jgi:ATP-dependent RNA helicase MSS116
VPSIQNLTHSPAQNGVSVLVLSPTRELAMQIADAARGLLKGRGGDWGVQCVVGGTNMSTDQKNLANKRADVLIATPGRLIDLLQNGNLGPKLAQLRCLVLDEADRLLDAGFRNELLKIMQALPDRNRTPRQTLLFSATIPKEVHTIASLALLPSHKFITTLTEADNNTHEHVEQFSVVVPPSDILAATLELIEREQKRQAELGGFKSKSQHGKVN